MATTGAVRACSTLDYPDSMHHCQQATLTCCGVPEDGNGLVCEDVVVHQSVSPGLPAEHRRSLEASAPYVQLPYIMHCFGERPIQKSNTVTHSTRNFHQRRQH
jgi:hypothetical protein